MAWIENLQNSLSWCARRILTSSAEQLSELSGVVALTANTVGRGYTNADPSTELGMTSVESSRV